ncbi:MAG TPA: DUF2194 domain-containing protein [Erysipelotrichaceae bacterium]|nr:DUF2194 domain-containing protein [Erysipelotrichaceae bacterium]
MFSRKRLAYIIIITIVFSGLFFLFNLDHDFLRSQSVNSADELKPIEKFTASKLNTSDAGFLIVGNPQNESERQIKTNVVKAFNQIKAKITQVESITDADLVNDIILVFVVADVSQTGDLEKIAEYIRNGGQAIFAAGIPSENNIRYLDPVWGILERGSFTSVSDITFNEGYFPYEQTTIPNGYTTYSSNVRLEETCEILIQGNNEIPLVWTHPYDLGRITMINGTFMESKLSIGILIASINNTREYSIYPILSTKTIFLDAIPPLFDGNDENSFEYYGRSAESFVRDKLWAVLLQKASVLDLQFTSSFMAIDKQTFESQNANQQTFSYISREIIQNKGEITLSGNHVDLNNLTVERIEQTKSFFDNFFPNYNLHAYYPLYGKIDQNQIDLIQAVYPSFDIIRILYEGDPQTQSSGDYEVSNGNVIYPTTTFGYKAEGLQMYTFISVLTSHGSISHSFDINSLFTVPSSESNWNTLNKSFDILVDLYFKKTPWLESVTISPAAEKVKEMDGLDVETFTESNQITVACSDMAIGQKFLFYSPRKIKSAQGASYEEINSRYYLIEAQSPSFVLHY